MLRPAPFPIADCTVAFTAADLVGHNIDNGSQDCNWGENLQAQWCIATATYDYQAAISGNDEDKCDVVEDLFFKGRECYLASKCRDEWAPKCNGLKYLYNSTINQYGCVDIDCNITGFQAQAAEGACNAVCDNACTSFEDPNSTVLLCSGCNSPKPCRPGVAGYGDTESTCDGKRPLKDELGNTYKCGNSRFGNNSRGHTNCASLPGNSAWCDPEQFVCCPGETEEEELVSCTESAMFDLVQCSEEGAEELDSAIMADNESSTTSSYLTHKRVCDATRNYFEASIYCSVRVGCSWKHAYDHMENQYHGIVDECKSELEDVIEAAEDSTSLTPDEMRDFHEKLENGMAEERDHCSSAGCSTGKGEQSGGACFDMYTGECWPYDDDGRCVAGELDCIRKNKGHHPDGGIGGIFLLGTIVATCVYVYRRRSARREGASNVAGFSQFGRGADVYDASVDMQQGIPGIPGIPIGEVQHVEGVAIDLSNPGIDPDINVSEGVVVKD